MYRKGASYEPFTYPDDPHHDMWVGTISYDPVDYLDTRQPHEECIEVRAETQVLLSYMINGIITALNNPQLFDEE